MAINPATGKVRVLTDVDIEALIAATNKAHQKMKDGQDEDCKNGKHGFHTRVFVGGGVIHTSCDNCGESWGTPDVPMTC